MPIDLLAQPKDLLADQRQPIDLLAEDTPQKSFLENLINIGIDVAKDIPAQIHDLLNIPAALLGMPRPPMKSKLSTETVPYIMEKATTPIGDIPIPTLSYNDIRNIASGRFTYSEVIVSPSMVDIGFYGLMGASLVRNQLALARWNNQLNKLIKTEEVRGAVMNNMPAFENLMNQVGVKMEGMDLEAKTNFILNQAQSSPKLGTAIMDLVSGKIVPKTPITGEPAPITPTVAPATPVLAPKQPITAPISAQAEQGLTLAVKLQNGQILSDMSAKLHSDIVSANNINPDEVADVGFLNKEGKYEGTHTLEGKPLETLPEVPKETMEKVKGIVGKTELLPPPKGRGEIVPPEINFGTWKDKSALSFSRETLERNIEDIAGKDATKVKEFITEPIKKNETARAEWITEKRQAISDKMKELGIEFKSKESALTMRYGENRMTLDELKKESPRNWEKITEASDYFRNLYDEMLDDINTVRAKYGYEPIPKRQDYFRHYQEIGNTINNIGLILREQDLPTNIAGITSLFKPGKPFTTAELRRKGGSFTEDAIGAMDNYIDAISKQMFHIDSVQRARVLDKYIRTQSEVNEDVKLPNFAANLNEYANLIAGKKATFDRAFEGLFGRPLYGIVNFLKKRTGANMIGANVSSALMNFIPFTQSLATTKPQSAIKGLFEALVTPFNKTVFEIDGVKSELFTRRYPATQIAFNWFGKAEETANILFRIIDQFTVKSILAGKYYEGIDSGIAPDKAMKIADDYTAKIVADRAWGQLPNLMGSKTLGVVTQFQTEVNNMFSNIIKDIPRQYKGDTKKIFNALISFTILSFIFNEAYERTLGRRPTIDPIYAALTLMGMSGLGKDQLVGKRLWRTIVDIGGNVPFGNIFVQGGRFPISAGIPDINKILTSETGQERTKELMKPIYYFAMPLAGGQIKKTVEGTTEFVKGKSTTPKGKKRYKIEQDFANFMRGFLFGKNAFPEAREHYNKQGTKKKKTKF